MKNFILILTALFLITNCVSKQPAPFVMPDQSDPSKERQPSGLFDFLKGKSDNSNVTLMKCENCNSPHSDPKTVQLELEKKCSKDRLYYQDEFKQISDVFKLKRENFQEAQFPPACIVYAMRSWDAYEQSQPALAECSPTKISLPKDDPGCAAEGAVEDPVTGGCTRNDMMPIREKKMACVTSEYAYSTYNAFVDVMDCLDIPQRELLPKIWNESYFHVNTLAIAGDTGVGQLTGDAIQEVSKKKFVDQEILEIEYYKREMERAKKPSCDRLLGEPAAWVVVGPEGRERCGLMTPAANPLRNILYTGIFYRVITERITGIAYRAGKEFIRTPEGLVESKDGENVPLGGMVKQLQIKEKMESLGIENPNMSFIRQVLVTMAFNAGTRTATTLLDNYLKARIANNLPLTDKELDFVNTDSSAEIALLKVPRASENETDEAKEIRLKKLEAAREISYQKGLPQFIRLMQSKGSPGYASKVGYRGTLFNREIGANICTQPSFLQHFSPPKPMPAVE